MMAPLSAEIGDAAPWTAPDYLGETGGSSLLDSIYSDASRSSRLPSSVYLENRMRYMRKIVNAQVGNYFL